MDTTGWSEVLWQAPARLLTGAAALLVAIGVSAPPPATRPIPVSGEVATAGFSGPGDRAQPPADTVYPEMR